MSRKCWRSWGDPGRAAALLPDGVRVNAVPGRGDDAAVIATGWYTFDDRRGAWRGSPRAFRCPNACTTPREIAARVFLLSDGRRTPPPVAVSRCGNTPTWTVPWPYSRPPYPAIRPGARSPGDRYQAWFVPPCGLGPPPGPARGAMRHAMPRLPPPCRGARLGAGSVYRWGGDRKISSFPPVCPVRIGRFRSPAPASTPSALAGMIEGKIRALGNSG